MALRYSALTLALLALVLLASTVPAQVPGVAPAGAAGAAAGGVAGPAGVAAPAAAPPNNLWSFLCPTPEQTAACKQRLCNIPLTQFLGSALAPARAMSGGLLPRVCPGPLDANPLDLKKPPDSAEGAAARIKEKEAQAKARRAAVRYLGTVDCRRYPEAEAALVNALRGDENECVRWEAAMALSRGCCCTKKVMQALIDCVNGKKTTEPAETSERVKMTAAAALEHCLMRFCEDVGEETPPESPPEEKPPETPPESGTPPKPGERVARLRPDSLLAEARRALAQHRPISRAPEARPTAPPPESPPVGPSIEVVQTPPKVKPAVPNDLPTAVIHLTPKVATPAPVEPAAVAQPATKPVELPIEKPGRRSRDLFSVFRDSMKEPR